MESIDFRLRQIAEAIKKKLATMHGNDSRIEQLTILLSKVKWD